jgi:hypothetical protein
MAGSRSAGDGGEGGIGGGGGDIAGGGVADPPMSGYSAE